MLALRRLLPAARVQRVCAPSRLVAHRTGLSTLRSCSHIAMSTAPALDSPPHVFHMGPGTLRIDRSQLHGTIRERFLATLRSALGNARGLVLLQGGGPFHVYTTDGELIFKQESYFHFLFGVVEDSWYGAIDLASGQAHLFCPRLPDVYAVWMGTLKTPADYKALYAVDAVHYVDELVGVLAGLLGDAPAGSRPGPVYTLQGTNTDSGSAFPPVTFDGIERLDVQPSSVVFQTLTECRVKKTPQEVQVLRYANKIGAAGHVAMMQAAKPGMMEYQLESLFLHTCYSTGGCRLTGYTPISASGPNGAVLHYGHAGAPNDRQLADGDMMLVDMGCEYGRYGSDITCSWPVNGRFTAQQRVVYEAALHAHQAVIAAIKPGVAWTDLHALAYRIILTDLKAAGLLKGDVEDMLGAEVGALFMPHGLGHLLGIDTHDVGGYLPGHPERSARPGFKSLRTARMLEADMVVTVEPGVYFSDALLLPALKDPVKSVFLVASELERYRGFGGVRIEDNVVVTATGAESLTHVPRTVAEIEAVMAGGAWPVADA